MLKSAILTGYTDRPGNGECVVWGAVWGEVWDAVQGPVDVVVGGGGGAVAANCCLYSLKTEEVDGPKSGSLNRVSSKSSAAGGGGYTDVIRFSDLKIDQ